MTIRKWPTNMKHTEKLSLARRMQTNFEKSKLNKGKGPFQSSWWNSKKLAIENKLKESLKK